MLELTLGLFQTNTTAAVAEDLAARLLSEDPPNFEDTDFQQLLPVYDETVLDRLNRDLSGSLAEEMADAVRRVVPSGRGEGLYELLVGGWSRN